MSEETTRVQVECPKCASVYIIDVPSAELDALKEKGIATIAMRPPCGHASQVFLDAKAKYRGGQVADIVIEPGAIYSLNGGSMAGSPAGARHEEGDLVSKLASEIVIQDARDCFAIRSLGAEEKVDIAELALVSGDADAARLIFHDLEDFCKNIDDDDFARSLATRIEKIDRLVQQSRDISDILQEIEYEETESEKKRAKERQVTRLDEILVDLKFTTLTGDISTSEFEYKQARLLEVKRRLG